jgi:putative peptide zinc metalloprotease protein
LRLRLRRDLVIESQRYEGRVYFVLKDPVSLRYYRLKQNEHFLLQFLDGKRTLEDAQKAYERQYRPERLPLEHLESFAQQLLTAGLAQNESPRAGIQLFERRGKRRRSEWMQTLTNILYIKIPVIDPDRILNHMLGYLGWIFSLWFFALSVTLMLSAAMLVAMNFDAFRAKLPNYHEFFSFKTVAYLWVALAVVKVIHEFGHGLSCKRFGGEVHEMGALFLCFSPALYCNVSDAWTLPNKWHRIVISFAGIYVELVIAAISTFVWWNTAGQPFINNLSLSLMVVCSVSTVVFNANPLMRYDGYYVLADWLEIPNLRERSNRYLTNLVLEFCLGVEVPPETYMALWRRMLFVIYAIVSYVYKWVVTFTILYFMYNFLRPYKLEVLSTMLALAALASMLGWPLYRMIQNINRRGRLPDMKRIRVAITATALVALLAFLLLVPVPISRVMGMGLIQALPESSSRITLAQPGKLLDLKVTDGDEVHQGDQLAEFTDSELEAELDKARTQRDAAYQQIETLQIKGNANQSAPSELDRKEKLRKSTAKYDEAKEKIRQLQDRKQQTYILLAPRDGIVHGAPRKEDVGRAYEKDVPFCTVTERRRLCVLLPVETADFNRIKANVIQDTSAAQSTRRRLQERVNQPAVTQPLKDVLEDLARRASGSGHRVQFDKDLSATDLARPVSLEAGQRRLADILNQVLEARDLGYYVKSGGDNDGGMVFRASRERGYQEGPGGEPDLAVTVRIQGRDSRTWQGRLQRLPESEMKTVPLPLSSKAGGPVPVKAGGKPDQLIPQTQYYLVVVDILNPDDGIVVGCPAHVKVHCRPETCAHWAWRKINNLFELGLM